MTNTDKELLKKAGINLNEALNRFMNNEALYERFLRKFPADKTFYCLKDNLEKNNISEAFVYAHTLKGLCGNLELSTLSEIINPMSEKLRLGETDDINEMMNILEKHYL